MKGTKKKKKNIVLHINPCTNYDLDAIFTELDNNGINDLNAYFIPNLYAIDALRVILYKLSLSTLFYKKRILLNDTTEDLHQFRVNIRKSRAFLKEFAFLFPKKTYKYFNANLDEFATLTNHKRDLDVIKERLIELDDAHAQIQENILKQQKKEYRKIQVMLESQTFEDFFHIYQNALKGETLRTFENTTDTIEHTARKVIQDLYADIIKKIDSIEEKFDDKKLHKIRIAFKKLRYLLEEFQHIFGEEKIANMIEHGKKLQELLGNFNDVVNQKKLLHNYFENNKKKIKNSKAMEHTLLDKTAKTQKKLMHKSMKRLEKFKKKKLDL